MFSEFFCHVNEIAPCLMCTGNCFPGGGWGLKLTTHLHLVPRWWMRGPMPLFPHAFSWPGA